ncbi:MAG TPA: hypothetical protein PLM75_07060 [bacterium]|nr:hypothetical protein [bacterium]
MILILSLIETNYFLGAGVILYLLILNFDISTIFKLSIILLLFFAFSLIFLDYSRHREFLNFSSFDFFQALNYFLLIFIVFLGIFTFDKILIIALPYILSVCYSNVSNFFNFSNIDFLPTINFYYAVPIITLLLIALLKKIKTCQMQVLNKKIFVLPIIFFFLSANYGLKEKIIFFDFLNNNNAIEYSKIAKLKEKIPREEKLYVQWLYADLFSDYHNLKFYSTTFKNEKKIDGNIFLDLQLDYLDISDNDAIAFANEINYIKKLIEQNVYKIIYIDDRYLILKSADTIN